MGDGTGFGVVVKSGPLLIAPVIRMVQIKHEWDRLQKGLTHIKIMLGIVKG